MDMYCTIMAGSGESWQQSYTGVSSRDDLFSYLHNAYADGKFYATGIMVFPSTYAPNREVDLNIRTHDVSEFHVALDSVIVHLSAMSEDAYLYYCSMSKYDNADMDDETDISSMIGGVLSLGAEELVPIYNNVENGYGVVIGRAWNRIVYKGF